MFASTTEFSSLEGLVAKFPFVGGCVHDSQMQFDETYLRAQGVTQDTFSREAYPLRRDHLDTDRCSIYAFGSEGESILNLPAGDGPEYLGPAVVRLGSRRSDINCFVVVHEASYEANSPDHRSGFRTVLHVEVFEVKHAHIDYFLDGALQYGRAMVASA